MCPDAAIMSDLATAVWAQRPAPALLAADLAGMILGGGAFTALSVPAVARFVLPPPRDTRLADHLPFDRLNGDGRTLSCRDGTLVQCLVVEGRDITFLSLAEREALFRLRKNWLDAMAEMGVTVRGILLRERAAEGLDDCFEQDLLKTMSHHWNASFSSTFRHRQVIALSLSGKGRTVGERLQEASETTLQLLAPYKPRMMCDGGAEDTHLMALWGFLASPLSRPRPAGAHREISELIATDIVEFTGEQGLIRFRRGDQEKCVAVIGLRRFGDHVDEQMVADLGGLDCEFVLLNLVEPWSKAMAALKVAQENRMSMVTRFSAAASEQYDAAMEIIEGLDETRASLASYALTLFLIADGPEQLALLDGEVRKICAAYGAASVREGAAAQASWFSLFPGYQPWPRSYRLFSSNIACHLTFDRAPAGQSNCDWGEGPLAMFRTLGGTSYAFQLHVSAERDAVAHAVCIGPTGSGKTTLMSFLAGMALRHPRLRAYIFDRYQGAFVFTTAVGGSYVNLTTGGSALAPCGLNPFQCADTPENRAFLRLWLRAISGCEDSDSLEEIALAVQSLFDSSVPMAERSLTVLFEPCFSSAMPLKRQLQKWVDPSAYGAMFNAPCDTLDMRSSRLVSFDMTDIFKDELLTQATLSYLMHRIQATIGEANAPAFIFIDETEPMLRNPQFRTYYLTMLQEYRKRGAAVISAFQRPEAIAQAGMSEAIRGQCQTMFFFPNPQAKAEDYADWSLTDSEWAYIKGSLPLSRRLRRSVLVKRAGGESVVLDTDLSALGPLLKIFASGRESVAAAAELQRRFGNDWVEHYLAAR
jgi:type IV secretion/conjugal transfer VirB4 family ATPase